MTARYQRARDRERALDLAALRDAVEHDEPIYGTDRRIRRLVLRGWATNPDYTYGAARDALADITEAGRAEAGKER